MRARVSALVGTKIHCSPELGAAQPTKTFWCPTNLPKPSPELAAHRYWNLTCMHQKHQTLVNQRHKSFLLNFSPENRSTSYPISMFYPKQHRSWFIRLKEKNSWAPIFDYLMLFERPLGIWRGERKICWEQNFDSLTPSVKPLDGPIWGIKYLLLSLMPINTATTMAV